DVYNYATAAGTYSVNVFDSVTGTMIGTVPLTIPANSNYSAPFTWFEQQLNWKPTSAQYHATLVFVPQSPATFQLELTHRVMMPQSLTFVNMTERCGFVSSSAAQLAFVGTVAGGKSQSGTLSVTLQNDVSSAAAPIQNAADGIQVEKPQSVNSA